MARIKVKDIRTNQKISTDELKRIRGGAGYIKFDGINYSSAYELKIEQPKFFLKNV